MSKGNYVISSSSSPGLNLFHEHHGIDNLQVRKSRLKVATFLCVRPHKVKQIAVAGDEKLGVRFERQI